jgi:outer membrane protein assembly factor BamB
VPLLLGMLVLAAAVPTGAADWPQWRGPYRRGISPETQWSSRWPGGAPRRLWAAQVGQGFSSVAVKSGRVYTLGNVGGQDVVSCLHALNGKVLWQYRYPADPGDYGGPRATPTVHENKVYTLGREGQALCLDAATGKLLWRRDVARETGAQAPRWGFAGSALIQGNLALYNVGAAGVANRGVRFPRTIHRGRPGRRRHLRGQRDRGGRSGEWAGALAAPVADVV